MKKEKKTIKHTFVFRSSTMRRIRQAADKEDRSLNDTAGRAFDRYSDLVLKRRKDGTDEA